jgi:signal transduction histidine kinase
MRTVTATSRSRQWAVIAACTVVAIVSSIALVALGYPRDFALLRIAAYSASFLVAGSVAWLRRPESPIGPVMLATSVFGSLTFFGAYPDPAVGQLAGVFGSLTNLLGVWFILAAPTGRLAPGPTRWLLVAFGVVLALANIVRDLEILRLIFAAGLVTSLLIAIAVIDRWRRASGASRRALTPVVIAGVVISLVHVADYGAGVLLLPITRGSPVFWGSIISRTLVPFGFLLGLFRLRMARAAVADLVVDLGEMAAPERLRDALAEALGDPGIEVCYWSRARAAYLTARGEVFDPGTDRSDRATVYLERGDEPLAVILHDPALADDPGLVAAVAAAVRLAVENERLTAEVEAQLAEVHASRARIVAAGDAERRRVERDLHDGAQQRLVAMSLALRLLGARLGKDADPEIQVSLDAAASEARAALAELRELARGIHPQILTQAGLGAAVTSLASRSPVAVAVEMDGVGRYDPAVESAGYFVVSEALANVAKYANAAHAAVRGTWQDDVLSIEVTDDGVGGADPATGSGLRGLIDRLAAVDGTLEISSPAGAGTRLHARIPTGVALPA